MVLEVALLARVGGGHQAVGKVGLDSGVELGKAGQVVKRYVPLKLTRQDLGQQSQAVSVGQVAGVGESVLGLPIEGEAGGCRLGFEPRGTAWGVTD